MRPRRRGHKAIVFALDEFDAFARPARQALLYNLLDALQGSQVQVRGDTNTTNLLPAPAPLHAEPDDLPVACCLTGMGVRNCPYACMWLEG